jgi:biopolymer transport protein ExbD
MALKSRFKRSAEFSSTSISDLVFLLLIFFMLTSTLVSPNAIKLLYPSSASKTIAKQTVSIYIDEQSNYFVQTPENKVTPETMGAALLKVLGGDTEATIVLKTDRKVPIESVVKVYDVINSLNNERQTQFKLILATSPQ